MMSKCCPQPPRINPEVWPLPRSLATTDGISVDVSSSPYLDVSVQAVPRIRLFDSTYADWHSPVGLPHSEIPGSMDICSSPRLIAACHVLHRLLMPRHSPCALCSLTCSSLPFQKRQVCQRNLGSLRRIMQASQIVVSIAVTLPFRGSFSTITSSVALLCFVFSLFSFQGAVLTFAVRFEDPTLFFQVGSPNPLANPGGDKRDRTADLLLARQALSQLSYTPVLPSLVGLSGLEPPTLRLSVVRSSQLSYRPLYLSAPLRRVPSKLNNVTTPNV